MADFRISVLVDAIDQASGQIGGIAGGIQQHAVKLAAAGAAVTAAMGFFTQAALVQESVEDRLRKIYPENADALIEYAAAMQLQTRYGDELIINAQAIGVTYPKLRAEMEMATKTALNMAEAYGMDVVQAMHLLGKASAGQYGMLSRYGILIDKTRVQADGMAEVYRAIGEETKNVAFTSESGAKSVAQMKNALGDTAEAIGGALLPMIMQLAPAVQELAGDLGEFARTPMGEFAIKSAAGIGVLLTGLGGLGLVLPTLTAGWAAVAPVATVAWAAMSGPIGLVVGGLTAVGVGIYEITQASEHQRDVQAAMFVDFTSGAATSEKALQDTRRELEDLIVDAEAARGALGSIGDEMEPPDFRELSYDERADKLREAAQMRIAETTEDTYRAEAELALARETYGAQSRQAIHAEIELMERRQSQNRAERADLERRAPGATWFREEKEALDESFAAYEANRQALLRSVGAHQELGQVVQEVTADQEKAADAAGNYGDSVRDAARSVEDAGERITEANEGIAQAEEDKADRIEDADDRIREAQERLVEGQQRAAESIADAEERAQEKIERAQERVADLRERIARDRAGPLTKEQQEAQRQQEMMDELREAQEELATAQREGPEEVAKAQRQALKDVAGLRAAVVEAEEAKAQAVEDGEERVTAALKRLADAHEAAARAEETSIERVQKALDKLQESYNKLGGGERTLRLEIGGTVRFPDLEGGAVSEAQIRQIVYQAIADSMR